MIENYPDTAQIIRFPRQLRVVPVPVPEETTSTAAEPATIVDHDGRLYRLADLTEHLSPTEVQEVSEAVPRTGQAAWNEVVRRWPALAAEIVAACDAVG